MTMKINELTNKIGTTYLDLDGVIVWLNKSIAEFNNVDVKDIDAAGWDSVYWERVLSHANVEEFFANAELEPHAIQLLNWFTSKGLPIKFLTRPVRKDEDACISGKKKWLKKFGLDNIPCIFEYDKEKYATNPDGTVNILIDDHSGNIQKFSEAGGIGIWYRDFWFPKVVERLQNLYGVVDEDK